MEPVAYGALAYIAGTAVLAVFLGALAGPLVWRFRGDPFRGGLLSLAVYIVAMVALEAVDMGSGRVLSSLKASAFFGALPFVMTFLVSYLAARLLERRYRLRPFWIILIAFLGTCAAGIPYLRLFRNNPWLPVRIAAVADAGLLILAYRMRKPRT